MMKIAGVLILVLVICPTITSATETRGGRDDDLSDDKIWTSLIAFHYPGLVVPPGAYPMHTSPRMYTPCTLT
ncbi:hypothetical protein OsI_27649 [Oryza sativa Indica Group]|uniref:Uncharacterized protein n=1 Tax=Oryza sativa subsp. indica TaxID=39946 RepID=A2YQS4_ORYSI|nr:hypothetical protein OsI_27649 [Oryza sativa Indica Group]